MNEKCVFSKGGWCGALMATRCKGNNTSCSFFKTEKQYIEDSNRAIEINRKKRNCIDCKYVSTPCQPQSQKCRFGGIDIE